jgi:hypothetical protein
MKVLYAPDTSDNPNWGCRFMGDWYRRELVRRGAKPAWKLGSRWFYQLPEGMPEPRSWAEVQRIGESVRGGTLQLGPIAQALANCDLVLMNGENYLRPQVLKGRMLLLFAYLASQVFGRRVILTNISLDLSEPALAGIAARVLPGLAEVNVREETSRAAYARLLPGAAAGLYPDPGWTARPRPVAEWGGLARRDGHLSAWPDVVEGFDPFRPYVTLGASSAFAGDAAAVRAAAPAFAELARRLRALELQVLLVATCQVDTLLMRQLAARTGLPLLGLRIPVEQAIDVLGHARLHVGGRWHPGIFATTGGTPLVALEANNHKMRTLAHELQPGAPVFDARALAAQLDDVLAHAQAQLAAGESLRASLRGKAAAMAARVHASLDRIALPG